jgi:hypothetical protein
MRLEVVLFLMVEGRSLRRPFFLLVNLPVRHSCESRNPVTSRFDCRLEASVPPTRRAFRTAAAARVTFLLLAQKKSNPKKMAYNARSIVLG